MLAIGDMAPDSHVIRSKWTRSNVKIFFVFKGTYLSTQGKYTWLYS